MHSVRIVFAILAIPAVLAAGAIAAGEHLGHGNTGELHEMMDQVMQRIGATADQRKQLEAVHERHDATTTRIHAVMEEAHERLAQAIHAEVFDEAAIRAAAADYAEAQADMFVSQAELFQDARRILTPDQLEQLRGMHGDGDGQGHGMHGDGDGQGHGMHGDGDRHGH